MPAGIASSTPCGGSAFASSTYTRKSTEHNLDLEFNSLDAQREEAETVWLIFRHYLELGSIGRLAEDLDRIFQRGFFRCSESFLHLLDVQHQFLPGWGVLGCPGDSLDARQHSREHPS